MPAHALMAYRAKNGTYTENAGAVFCTYILYMHHSCASMRSWYTVHPVHKKGGLGLLMLCAANDQTSRLETFNAFSSMNARRGSTSSPIRVEKSLSAPITSSMVT